MHGFRIVGPVELKRPSGMRVAGVRVDCHRRGTGMPSSSYAASWMTRKASSMVDIQDND